MKSPIFLYPFSPSLPIKHLAMFHELLLVLGRPTCYATFLAENGRGGPGTTIIWGVNLLYMLRYGPGIFKEKNHENISKLIWLANMKRALNCCCRVCVCGGGLIEEYSWNQLILFTTLRLLVSCIYIKHSYSIEEYI